MSISVAELSRQFGLSTATGPLAAEKTLPVNQTLAPLLGSSGLRRGSSLSVTGTGSLSLAIALAAQASSEGYWCTVLGLPGLGLGAVSDLGVDLERLVCVPDPGQDWLRVLSILVESVDLLIVRPPGVPPPAQLNRLSAKLREREAVLIAMSSWPGSDTRLNVVDQTWHGLENGHGRLSRRNLRVRAEGRGGARDSIASVWLPNRGGGISAAVAVDSDSVGTATATAGMTGVGTVTVSTTTVAASTVAAGTVSAATVAASKRTSRRHPRILP
ncbi:hypothetical protein LWF01_08035 [Saxibacter everestensis]|uniref:Recombinase A n=1 Tax=Saxibacter everestensis TaxID=2909229 RepID=A0ABY8QXF6_9MICO|nr:hypothetical protein LWF01_08035 [Brevibacteriaceae bacterium ZFBP1038]